MLKFDSFETEQYYYKQLKEHHIIHISWEENSIITKHNVDMLISTLDGIKNNEIESIPFEEFP